MLPVFVSHSLQLAVAPIYFNIVHLNLFNNVTGVIRHTFACRKSKISDREQKIPYGLIQSFMDNHQLEYAVYGFVKNN